MDIFGEPVVNTSYQVTRSVVDTLDHCFDAHRNIVGKTVSSITPGYTQFSGMIATCFPSGNLTTEYAIALSYASELAGSLDTKIAKTFQLWKFPACVSGQILKENSCVRCPLGTCSLTGAPLTDASNDGYLVYSAHQLQSATCIVSPSKPTADPGKTFGDQLFAMPDYWRISPRAYDLLPCPMKSNACRGGNSTGDKSCQPGYHRPLCNLCNAGSYFSSAVNQCVSCDGVSAGGLLALPIIVISFLMLLISFQNLIQYYFEKLTQTTKQYDSKYRLTKKFKILIVFYQVSLSLF